MFPQAATNLEVGIVEEFNAGRPKDIHKNVLLHKTCVKLNVLWRCTACYYAAMPYNGLPLADESQEAHDMTTINGDGLLSILMHRTVK